VISIAEWLMNQPHGDRSTVRTVRVRRWTTYWRHSERSADLVAARISGVMDSRLGDEDWTCDRRECFDARGRLVLPGAAKAVATDWTLRRAFRKSGAERRAIRLCSFFVGAAASLDQVGSGCLSRSCQRAG
jgi:hypothetical protein